MGLGIPPLKINIVLKSNPRKSTMLVGRLGVALAALWHAARTNVFFLLASGKERPQMVTVDVCETNTHLDVACVFSVLTPLP